MSAICGVVGPGEPSRVARMLETVPYRGDRVDVVELPGGGALGYRWWGGRPGKSPGIHRGADGAFTACAGTLAPPAPDPAASLDALLGEGALDALDGAFAVARWHEGRLTLLRDPFGVRSLFYAHVGGVFCFASELKMLLAMGDLPREPWLPAIHGYLSFSFVPGAETPLRGVRRLLPGHRLERAEGSERVEAWFVLREDLDPELDDAAAARAVRTTAKDAVRRRLNGEPRVGLYLSGGIDSSAVGFWLRHVGQEVTAFSLDFGDASVEREHADDVARVLGIPLVRVPADGARVGALLDELVHLLDLPFGDPVTGPQLLLGHAARDAGLTAVFNGEGGDQLFGGWTSKPMVAAAIFGGPDGEDLDPEDTYLRSYHRFYGLEDALYTPALAEAVGGRLHRRALLAPFLGDETTTFLNRVRLADLNLKGCQNLLPRAERTTNGLGLDLRVPLFDRALAELSFRIPPRLKLHGATEKYVLKRALQDRLPDEIVWRRKFGMSVPITDWVFGPAGGSGRGPLYARVQDTLSPEAVRRRGWFRPEYVAGLLAGDEHPGEVRRRRLGEKVWALVMLECWARRVLDGGAG